MQPRWDLKLSPYQDISCSELFAAQINLEDGSEQGLSAGRMGRTQAFPNPSMRLVSLHQQ